MPLLSIEGLLCYFFYYVFHVFHSGCCKVAVEIGIGSPKLSVVNQPGYQ